MNLQNNSLFPCSLADWLGPLHQSANRLAYLYFLREIGKVDAFLATVYFTGDPHFPTTRHQWGKGIRAVSEQLGIASPVRYSVSGFLAAIGRKIHLTDPHKDSGGMTTREGDFVVLIGGKLM